MNTLRKLRKTARQLRQEQGLWALIRAGFLFLIKPVYTRTLYYLYIDPLDPVDIESNLANNKPEININDLNFKVVSSNQEAEQLEKEGFEFRSYRENIHHRIASSERLLDYGLLAFCTFIGKEFAAISWVIPSQQTQDNLKAPPLKVNYADHEAFPRGAWCNPKYRRLGIYRYTINNRDRYLVRMGINMLRSTTDYQNQVGLSMCEWMGDIKCGRARYMKILCWRFWRENYFSKA